MGSRSRRAPNLISLTWKKCKFYEHSMKGTELHLLHHTSGFGLTPTSHCRKDGSKTRVQYSFERSI